LRPTEPLPLHHSWPLFERERRFELGKILACAPAALPAAVARSIDANALAGRGVGLWECDLSDDSLTWSAEVYDIFGLPRAASLRREVAVALYGESSRVIMERLRAYAIKHRRGFTVDAQILPARGRPRWMRLVAAPICEGGRVVRLHGFKQIVPVAG
jgi:PAS domain-containing protein